MCLLVNVTRTIMTRKVIAHELAIGKKVPGKQSGPILGEQGSLVLGEQNSPIETMMSF